MSTNAKSAMQHALVIGGGLAGLLAARVLSDVYEKVSIVEREPLPEEAQPRRGVPQSHHIHALLERGRAALDELLPGYTKDMVAAGAQLFDGIADCRILSPSGRWRPLQPAGRFKLLSASRPLIEWGIRQRVRKIANIRWITAPVVGFAISGERIAGVRCLADTADGKEQILNANLVVDASGRSSQAPPWLEQAGFERPRETIVDAAWAYASCRFRIPADWTAEWSMLSLPAAASMPSCGGAIACIENGEWIVTLKGRGEHIPPTDESGFIEFARQLASPLIFEALGRATRITPILGWRSTQNRIRHYEESSRRPAGLLVAGDAACTFNPVYGQGITLAALDAILLRETLRDHRSRLEAGDIAGLAADFQHRVADTARFPWSLAAGADAELCGIPLAPDWSMDRELAARMARLRVRAEDDPQAYLTMQELMHLLRPPESLPA